MNAVARAPSSFRRVALATLGALALLLALDLAFPPPLDPLVSQVVQDRHGRTLRAFPVDEGRWRLRADLDHIDQRYVRALIAMEDERFVWLTGVVLGKVAPP